MHIELDGKGGALMDSVFAQALTRTGFLAKTRPVYAQINARIVELAGRWPEVDAADVDTLDIMFAEVVGQMTPAGAQDYADLYGYIMDDCGLAALDAA